MGRFIKVKCSDCSNEQVIFKKASTEVLCQVCGGVLAESTGGVADIKGEIIEELA